MIKLIKNKKFLFLFGGFLLACLFLFKTPSLAQTPAVCPNKPIINDLTVDITLGWSIAWQQQTMSRTTGSVRKTSGASPATGKCYSSWVPNTRASDGSYFSMATNQNFCNCNPVGFKVYNQKVGCPDVESDEIIGDFGSGKSCMCTRADYNSDDIINAIDISTFISLYASCLNCTPWTCSWLTCGKLDVLRDGIINSWDQDYLNECNGSTFCWCRERTLGTVSSSYVCEGRYYGKSQCKARAVTRAQGACVLDPKWGKIDPKNPTSSINSWKWTYCYPQGQSPVSTTPVPTSSTQKVCEGKYFGEPQCRARVTPKPGYSCQLNPALGSINTSNLSDSINYWKWSYCKN